ncbi:interferon-inducible GTPase 5-like isoform X2 [Pristis pectinata]|nr:interferon-inducible GTPase 5-like isoform X2 [Pristis pectinata]
MDPSSNSVYFSLEELKDLESAYESGGMEKVVILIQEKLNKLKSAELHIAVTGESGAGKSTFINAMRGLRSIDEGAAKIGITETTMVPTQYKHPSFPEVCFWDLPGVGTTTFPVKDYLREMKFQQYDFFIIISRGRFTENYAKLAQEIKTLGKHFYFVRSQIDNDLRALEIEGRNAERKTELTKIRNACVGCLREAGISQPTVFLISSFQVNEFDFSALWATLINNVDNMKKDIFLKSLPNIALEIVEWKRDQLKKRLWMLATVSGTVRAEGVSGAEGTEAVSGAMAGDLACDLRKLITAIEEMCTCLGLDDASLQRLANVARKPVEVLKAEVKTPLTGEINNECMKTMLQCSNFKASVDMELPINLVQIIASIFQTVSSAGITYKLLSNALTELVKNAKNVVKAAFGTD